MIWFSDGSIAGRKAEPRTTRGGQAWDSPLAILTARTLRAAFRLPLRQTEGLVGSIIRHAAPDPSAYAANTPAFAADHFILSENF